MKDIIIVSIFIVLSGFIALEIGIATAITELIAGMVAGEFVSFQSTEIIDVLANLGILMLMYVAGLEIDLDVLRQSFKQSAIIGTASFVFPFGSIFILSSYFFHLGYEESLLASIALSTTSVALVYPILQQTNFLGEKSKLILSAAMVTDILSMSALGIFFSGFSLLLIFLIFSLFIFTYIFPFFGSRIFKYYKGNVAEFEFKIILLLLLAVAMVSESAGIEAAITAFLIGMITSGVVVEHENLGIKLHGIVFGFFAPIFFFKVGLGISFMSLLENIHLIMVFLIVGFSSNFIGTFISSWIFMPKYSSYIASLFGSNLNLGIITATLGYGLGYLDLPLYSSIIGAVVLSTALSSFLCRRKKPG